MSYETGAPPPPDHQPVKVEPVAVVDTDHHDVVPVRPARGFDATTAILPGPPPGTTTVRLRATETTQTTE